MARVRVVLADDHRLVLDTVEALLDADGDFDVAASVETGEQLLRALATIAADVVVLDIRMPGMDGLECLELLSRRHPGLKVVILSGLDEPRVVQRALRLGAAAFVRKDLDPRDLAAVLRQTLEDTVVSQPAFLQDTEVGLAEVRSLLTPSELAVLNALAQGLVNKQIASDLGIAQQTVKFHLTKIYRKLGVTNRTEAVRFAFERGLADRQLVAV